MEREIQSIREGRGCEVNKGSVYRGNEAILAIQNGTVRKFVRTKRAKKWMHEKIGGHGSQFKLWPNRRKPNGMSYKLLEKAEEFRGCLRMRCSMDFSTICLKFQNFILT